MAKNGGKIERSSATPIKLFSVDSYNQETISFKFGNDIFIIFEMLKGHPTLKIWHFLKKFRYEIPYFSSSGGTIMSNLSNNISSLVNDKKVKEANIDLIERSKHVPLRLTLAERKLLRLCEAALGQTRDMFSQIVRIRNYEFFHKYF